MEMVATVSIWEVFNLIVDESKRYITINGVTYERLDRLWKRVSKHKLLVLGIPVVDMVDLSTVIFKKFLTDKDCTVLERLRRNPQVKSITVDEDIVTINFKDGIDIESFNLTLNVICSVWFDESIF